MFVSKFILYYLYAKYRLLKIDYSWLFYRYNSITVLASSFCLFMFFLNLDINNKFVSKIILFLSPLTFGVYLIYDNLYVREVLYTNILHTRNYLNSNKYFAVAMISILAVFIVCCIIIYYIRFLLFKLIIILCDKLSNKKKVLKS